jgi:hypothetical protein
MTFAHNFQISIIIRLKRQTLLVDLLKNSINRTSFIYETLHRPYRTNI